jgi:hypothetical protein
MKSLTILIFVSLLFVSCQQNNNNNNNPAIPVLIQGSISYTINDTLNIQWDTKDVFTKSNLSCGLSGFVCPSPTLAGRQFYCALYTDNFQNLTTYFDTMNAVCNIRQLQFLVYENNKVYGNKYWVNGLVGKKSNDTWLNITSLTDSTITGTFAARTIGTAQNYTDTLKISNGSFYLNFMD